MRLRWTLNGKKWVAAGHPNASISHVILHHNAKTENFDLHIGGLTQENADGIAHHYRWAEPELQIGDVISVEIIETIEATPPVELYRSDHEAQENPFTEKEQREMQYQDYLELKKEFQPDT